MAAIPLPPTRTVTRPQVVPAEDQREQRINAKIEHHGRVLAVLAALAKVLAVRVYLFFALIGAFVIGCLALDAGTWIAFAILIAYSVLSVLPLCILDGVLHRRPGA